MHIHLPKPMHGWRAFVGEVGVIVLGISIAIGFEQVVETAHWKREVHKARRAIDDDMVRTNRAFAYRVAAQGCIQRRINSLNEIVERVAKHEPSPSIGSVVPDIGNGLGKTAWETSRAAQTLAHFEDKELASYGSYYMLLDNIQAFMGQEVTDWGVLRILEGDPTRLGPADLAALRIAVKHATFENHIIAAIATDELETSRTLGVATANLDQARLSEVCQPLR